MNYVVYYPSNAQSKMVAGARIARWLHEHLPQRGNKVWLVDGKSIKNFGVMTEDYILFMVNVPKTMISDVPATEDLVERARTVVWIQNDYSIWAPTTKTAGESIVTRAFTRRIRWEAPTFVWSTCGHRVDQNPEDYRYINWNALAYQPPTVIPMRRNKTAVLYYGSFREGRLQEFDKYFIGHADLWVIAAPKSAETKFMERYEMDQAQMLGVIDIPEDLKLYSSTVYMEDDLSHRQFHSPANRFYEALSADLAIWVDKAAVHTLEEAGYEVPGACIVGCAGDIRPSQTSRLLTLQRKWHLDPATGKDHQTALKLRLKELLKELV